MLCKIWNRQCSLDFFLVHSLQDNSYVCTLSDNSSEYITCMACLEGVMTSDNYTTGVTRIITGGNNAELKVWDLVCIDDQTRYVSCLVETAKSRIIVFKIHHCMF